MRPVDVLMLPKVDWIASLIAGSHRDDRKSQVEVTSDAHHLSYSINPARLLIFGNLDGDAFALTGTLDHDSGDWALTGVNLPFQAMKTRVAPGAFAMTGQAADVPFHLAVSLGDTESTVSGEVGDEPYRLAIRGDLEAGNATADGNLGSRPIAARVEKGANGTWLVHEQIGEVHLEEVISR